MCMSFFSTYTAYKLLWALQWRQGVVIHYSNMGHQQKTKIHTNPYHGRHACVCNVFDRIIAARLNWFVEKILWSKTTKLASQEKDRSTMGHVIRLWLLN